MGSETTWKSPGMRRMMPSEINSLNPNPYALNPKTHTLNYKP